MHGISERLGRRWRSFPIPRIAQFDPASAARCTTTQVPAGPLIASAVRRGARLTIAAAHAARLEILARGHVLRRLRIRACHTYALRLRSRAPLTLVARTSRTWQRLVVPPA